MIAEIIRRRVMGGILLLLSIALWNACFAGNISRAPGIRTDGNGKSYCPGNEGSGIPLLPGGVDYIWGACTIQLPPGYLASGWYYVRLDLLKSDKGARDGYGWIGTHYTTSQVYVDGKKNLSEQFLSLSSSEVGYTPLNQQYDDGELYLCYSLSSYKQVAYDIYGTPSPFGDICKRNNPIPPVPVDVVNCKLNSGNALNVELGTLDRATMPTVPGSGDIKTVEFPVNCTGGKADVKMQLSYTPVTISGSQVVSTTTNGVGVAVKYNDKILSPSDVTDLQLIEGTSNMKLTFEAVRNPTVAVKDIATGAFNAGAVLKMTQQ